MNRKMHKKENPQYRALGRVLAIGIAGALVLVFAAGCDKKERPAAQTGPLTFTYGRPAQVTSLDLHTEITSNNAFAIDKIFEPLVSFNSQGEIYDLLAASHSVSADGLIYTFTLRDGLRFSNGSPVTAEDAVFSLRRHLDVGGPLEISADVASLEVRDDKTLVITLNQVYSPFIAELSNFANGIIPKDFGGLSEEQFFQRPIGTGPFAVQSWDPAGDLVFVKNEFYWQAGKPYIDKLVYTVIEDDTQAINQLKTGQVDSIEVVSSANAEELRKDPNITLFENGSWVIEQLFFNTLDEHFSDVRVRRALALAIDREGLTGAVTFGFAQTAKSLLPPTIPYNSYDTIKTLDFNIEAAKAELARSSFPQGFKTTLLIGAGDNARSQEAQIIQEAGAKIGIDITIESVDVATFRARFFAYDFSMMINSGQADSPEANSILAFQTDPNGFSKCYWTHYSNDEVTRLLWAGQQQADGPGRAETYANLQQILADEVPYIPLYYPAILKAASKKVQGLVLLPTDSVRFEDVRFSGN
jgi:peptide/nickel transport system substrate-binding protein